MIANLLGLNPDPRVFYAGLALFVGVVAHSVWKWWTRREKRGWRSYTDWRDCS